jgi:putative FmdB family regulatory protein
MPLYSYQCDNCGFRFEKQQKFTDLPITRCPDCKKNRVRKLLTPPGIVFKGSGWYATDHRSPSGASGGKKTEGKSEAAGESGGEKKSEKKTESKSSGGDD